MKRTWEKLKSIEGVILFFFLVRLVGILNPPLETWHGWRQTLTATIARNMSEHNFNLLYPTIDMGGERTGIIGSEFPLFQAIIAVFNLLFGFEHWYGRLISLVVSCIATWCFFQLAKRWWNERTAWFSTVIFLASLWFSFSRKVMPDIFAVSLVIIGIWLCQQYIDRQKKWLLVWGGLFLTLGGLCKIPAVFLFILVIAAWMTPSIRRSIKFRLMIVTAIASSIIAWWYFYWVPYLVNTYHSQLYFSKSLSEGWKEIRPLLNDFAAQFYFGAMRSYVALLPILLGIVWLCYRNHRRQAIAFILLALVFLVFCIKTGAVFPTHNYYVLPFVPVMAIIAGIGLQRLDGRLAIALLVVITIEGIGNQISDFRIKDEVRYKLTLEKQLNSLIPQAAKIVIPTGPDPQWMYFYHRKGWSLEPSELEESQRMKTVAAAGGTFIVIDKRAHALFLPYPVVGETSDVIIYSLSSTGD